MSPPTRMPDYDPQGRRRWKPLMDVADATPRMGKILGISAQELLDTVGLAASAGYGVMFTPTQDGGALGVHLYADEEKFRQYAATVEELTAILASIRDRSEVKLLRGTVTPLKRPVRASQNA